MEKLTLVYPDDWHCHLRDGTLLARTVPDTAMRFQRAIIMPNLEAPVTTVSEAKSYQSRILSYVPENKNFSPLMTLFLSESMSPDTIKEAKTSGIIKACKLYPASATTHSHAGIQKLEAIYPLLHTMEEEGLCLLIHGESIEPDIDVFDREMKFIDKFLSPLIFRFPSLRIVLEHISTEHAVNFVKDTPGTLAATITPHHLLYNRNAIFQGGIRPHYYCLPILKRSTDQEALIAAAISGSPKFFLGTDSAPHALSQKESSCGCAGIYSAHAAIEIYAEIFENHQALDKLESFASIHGANFYQLPINSNKITLVKTPWHIPKTLTFGNETVAPLKAGETICWKIENE